MIKKIAYIFCQELVRNIFSPNCYDCVITINGEVKQSGGGHMNTLGSRIGELKKQGYQIISDKNHDGKNLPLPKEIKSKLEKELAK